MRNKVNGMEGMWNQKGDVETVKKYEKREMRDDKRVTKNENRNTKTVTTTKNNEKTNKHEKNKNLENHANKY